MITKILASYCCFLMHAAKWCDQTYIFSLSLLFYVIVTKPTLEKKTSSLLLEVLARGDREEHHCSSTQKIIHSQKANSLHMRSAANLYHHCLEFRYQNIFILYLSIKRYRDFFMHGSKTEHALVSRRCVFELFQASNNGLQNFTS